MGYSPHRFSSMVDDNLLCGICSCVLEDAVLTPCGHTFCGRCLTTWLSGSTVDDSCPACRGHVRQSDVRPVHALRNLVLSLEVSCEHVDRGCDKKFPLECMDSHLLICGHVPVDCAGCGKTVSREELADHHKNCMGMLAAASANFKSSCIELHSKSHAHVAELSIRVGTLEIQLQKLRADLDIAETRNKRLDKELRKTRKELEEKRLQILDQQMTEFDPDYDYGYTPKSIIKLSCLLARFLDKKPLYIDRDLIFTGLKRCYENFCLPPSSTAMNVVPKRPSNQVRNVQMLLATANSSDWFSDSQKDAITMWLHAAVSTC